MSWTAPDIQNFAAIGNFAVSFDVTIDLVFKFVFGFFNKATAYTSGGSRGEDGGDASPPPAVRHIGIVVGDV